MSSDPDDVEDYGPAPMTLRLGIEQFGLTVEVSAPGPYNPDQLDDMTTRAQRLLKSIADEYVAIARDLTDADDDEEPLDDDYEHDGSAPVGDLITDVPNPT